MPFFPKNTVEQQELDLSAFESIVGTAHLLTDEAAKVLYGQDISGHGLPVLAVVRPDNTEQLSALVAQAASQSLPVIPRGGGMSYTHAYVSADQSCLMIDLSRMNRILEINAEDMFVTVECGCTWQQLHEALEPLGLRTPYWGTLSGSRATIGGGLSQNSIFWGSCAYGTAADSVVGLDVVLSDGSRISTGSGAQLNGSPFFRHYGPDLTGLFISDTGAMGFKATATLRLIRCMPENGFVSFDFNHYEPLVQAISEISRRGLAAECFGFDPGLQQQRMKRESLRSDIDALGGVMKAQGSVLGALKEGAKVALSGRGFMKDVNYSVHFFVEDRRKAGMEAMLAEIRGVCEAYKGREIENSIPKIARANPFGPVNTMVGPEGERWLPVHGLVPHSKAVTTIDGLEKIIQGHREKIAEGKIQIGFLYSYISTNAFVIEPVFFWPDCLNELHHNSVDDKVLAGFEEFAENESIRDTVMQIRQDMIRLFNQVGAVHMQIGRTYPYIDGIKPDNRELMRKLKGLLDPDHRVNPGSLGL